MATWADYVEDARTGFAAGIGDSSTTWKEMGDSSRTSVLNMAQAQYENDYNEKMWNLQNEYNSPSAQMARYKAAGLNPNLIYSQGSSGNASSAPTAAHVTHQSTEVEQKLSKLSSALQMAGMVNQLVGNVVGVSKGAQELKALKFENYVNDLRERYFRDHLNGGVFSIDQNATISDRSTQIAMSYLFPGYSNALSTLGLLPYKKLTEDFKSDIMSFNYNNILPKMSAYWEGRTDINSFQKELLQYQTEFMKSLDPQTRQWLILLQSGLGAASKFF